MGHSARQSQPHLPALDGVRGTAVLLVVLYHTAGGAQSHNPALRLVGNLVKVGWGGVTLFFLLSGFLITGVLWDSRGTTHWLRNFYARRVLRIAPLYYGALLLTVLVGWITHAGRAGYGGLWIYALYLQNLAWVDDRWWQTRPLMLGHFWSLAVEEQFYLVWPMLLARVRTTAQMKAVCLGIFLGSLAFRYGYWACTSRPPDYDEFLGRVGELALGAYLAMSFRDGSWGRLERAAPWAAAASLTGFVAVSLVGGGPELDKTACAIWGLALISVFCAGLIVLALREGWIQNAMEAEWLRWLGKISYGIYVFHLLLLPWYAWLAAHLAPHADRVQTIVLRAIITWALTVPIAWASYRFFESPILGLRRYFKTQPR